MDGFNNAAHVLFGGRAEFLDRLHDDRGEVGFVQLGREKFFESRCLQFLFRSEFRSAALVELLERIAALFDFFLDDDDPLSLGEGFCFELNLGVAYGGLEHAEGAEAIGVFGQHSGLDLLSEFFGDGHAIVAWGSELGLRGLELFDGVAHFRCAFVIFPLDGFLKVLFQLFPFGERFLFSDLFHPSLKGLDLAAELDEIGSGTIVVELSDLLHADLDGVERGVEVLCLEQLAGGGPSFHHEQLGTELLERPGEFVGFRELLHEIEDLPVALSVFENAFIIV